MVKKISYFLAGLFLLIIVVSLIGSGNELQEELSDQVTVTGDTSLISPDDISEPTISTWQEAVEASWILNVTDQSLDNEGHLTVRYNPLSSYVYDTELIRSAIREMVSLGNYAFSLEEVNSIETIQEKDYTNDLGAETTMVTVHIILTKEEFKRFNWDNLKGKPVFEQIQREGIASIDARLDWTYQQLTYKP